MEVDPLEAVVGVVEFVKSRVFFVNVVEMLDQTAEAGVEGELLEVPVEALVVTPLLPLAELTALKKKLFAGVRPHQRVEHPQIGELLPHVSRHFAKQGAFSVHDLVVAEHQDEMFVEGVE